MKLKNIEDIRDHIVKSLEDLEKGKIEIDEASIIAKSGEAIFSSIKLQIMYNNMRNEIPDIKFLQDCNEGKKKEIEYLPKKLIDK